MLSLSSCEITYQKIQKFNIISCETETEIMGMSLSMSLRLFVNIDPGF